MQALFFLEEGLVKLLNLGHVHVDAEQPFNFPLLIEHPVRQGANMTHAFLHADAEFQLKRQAGNQGVPQHLLSVDAILRQHRVVPELPGGLDVRRYFIELKHPLIPADNVGFQIPLPDADAPGFVSQRNALHQALIDPFGLLQIVNVFNLGNKIERGAVGMAHHGDGKKRPDHFPVAGVIALLEGVGIDLAVDQLFELLEVGIQIFWPGELLEGQRLKLRLAVAEEIAQRLVSLKPFAFNAHQRHSDGGIFHRVTKALFAFGDVFAFGTEGVHHHGHHVSGQEQHQERQPGGVQHRPGVLGGQRQRIAGNHQRHHHHGDQKHHERFHPRQAHGAPHQQNDHAGEGPRQPGDGCPTEG